MTAKHKLVALYAIVAGFYSLHSQAIEISGELSWNRKVVLSTPLSGVISAVNVQPGDLISKGDVLIQLDDRFIKANLEQAQAHIDRTNRLLGEAQRELDRNIELFDRTVLSEHDRELAYIQFSEAQAAQKTAQAALVKAQLDNEHSALRAPFDGVVIRKHVEVGETIVSEQVAKPMLEVGETGVMAVSIYVSADTINKLKTGSKAKVSVAGKRFDAKVQYVGFEPTAHQKYEVNVVFATGGNIFRVGQGAQVSLP